MKVKNCRHCNIEFKYQPRKDRIVSFCCHKCFSDSNKGRVVSQETRKKISIKNSGKIRSLETKLKISKNNARFWVGKKRPNLHSEETKKRMSEMKKGKPSWNKGLKGFRAGKNHQWYGRNMSGENNPVYIKDRTQLKGYNSEERRSSAYVLWRAKVWKRDNWKCKINNQDCKGRIEAHHILGFTKYPELRHDINNGITLCHFHHPRKREDEINLSPYFKELVMNIK